MLAATIVAIGVPTPPRAEAVDPTPADAVVEWNNNAQIAIIGTAGQGPTVAYLHFAMVQGAVYDGVNAIVGDYEPYLGSPAMADPGDWHRRRSPRRRTTCWWRCSQPNRECSTGNVDPFSMPDVEALRSAGPNP